MGHYDEQREADLAEQREDERIKELEDELLETKKELRFMTSLYIND